MTADQKSNGVSDAIVLAVVTAIAYGMAYLYEAAYCNEFGIPLYLVSLSPTTILFTASMLLSWFFFFAAGVNLMGVFYPQMLRTPVGRAIHLTLLPVLGCIVVLILSRSYDGFWYLFWMLMFFGYLNLAHPLIAHREQKTYAEKLERQEQIEARVALFSDSLRRLSLPLRLLIIVSVVCLFGASLVGGGDARTQKEFLIPTSQPDRVVLRCYGNLLILAKFDRNSKVVTPEFSVVDVTSGNIASGANFLLEDVGPLEKRNNSP